MTACTVHCGDMSQALDVAISQASAPHHGFDSNDMPSHALLLLSKRYFPARIDNLGSWARSHISKATGTDYVDVACCVVDDVPGESPSDQAAAGLSLLLASEDERVKFLRFRDTQDRAISLGRAFKDQGQSDADFFDAPDWSASNGKSPWQDILSGGSASRQDAGADIVPEPSFRSALIVSDRHFGVTDWPTRLLPNARKVGLVTAATPFLTGRDMTMTFNDEYIENGGLAMAFAKPLAELAIDRHRLRPLSGDVLRIDKCQGNILISLDGKPATYALLDRLQGVIGKGQRLSKDVELFGEIEHASQAHPSGVRPIVKITSGDPGKGSIALNGGYKVAVGDALRLHYDDPSGAPGDGARTQIGSSEDTVTVMLAKTAAESQGYVQQSDAADDKVEAVVYNGRFGAASETGLVVGDAHADQRAWMEEAADTVIVVRP